MHGHVYDDTSRISLSGFPSQLLNFLLSHFVRCIDLLTTPVNGT